MSARAIMLHAVCSAGQALADETRERESIEAILSQQSAAWAAGDADAFVKAALDAVSFTNVMGMYTVGIEPFRMQHARIFATIYKGSRMTQTVERVAFIRSDVAVVDTLATLEEGGAPAARLRSRRGTAKIEAAADNGEGRRRLAGRGVPQRVHQSRLSGSPASELELPNMIGWLGPQCRHWHSSSLATFNAPEITTSGVVRCPKYKVKRSPRADG